MVESFVRVRCSSCSALVRVPRLTGRHPCADCGALISVRIANEDAAPPPLEPERSEPQAARNDASRRVAQAVDRLKLLRWFYLAGALLTLLPLVLVIKGFADPDLPPEATGIGVAVLTLGIVLQVCAFLLVLHQPLVWSLLVAGLATAALALCIPGAVALASLPATIPVLAALGLGTAVTWSIVAAAFRVRRLSRKHPKLVATKINSGAIQRRRPADLSEEEWAERVQQISLGQDRRTQMLAVAASAALMLLAAGSSYAVSATLRPQDFDAAARGFVEAWRKQDANELAELAHTDRRERISRRLANVAATRHWEAGWPELVETGREVTKRAATMHFLEDEDQIRVEWVLADRRWQLTAIVPPLPQLDEALETFVKAWGQSSTKVLAELFAPDSRSKVEAGMAHQVKKRNWGEKFPALEFKEARRVSEERAEATFDCDAGTLSVHWKLDPDDRWILAGIVWPKSE